jgi:hypothetical protein
MKYDLLIWLEAWLVHRTSDDWVTAAVYRREYEVASWVANERWSLIQRDYNEFAR